MVNKRYGLAMIAMLAVAWVSPEAVAVTAAEPQQPASEARVSELIAALDKQGLQSVAAQDPTRAGQLVAVLYVPGVQLLMITGRCDASEVLAARLAAAEYRDVYTDLHACAVDTTRLFIQDMSADGLWPEPRRSGAPFDIVYEQMTHRTRFDGDCRSQELTSAEYRQRFTTIDAEYARLASILVDSFLTH